MSDTHDGQRPLPGIQADLEAEAILTGLPKGMPFLSEIRRELARMGYPESDAADVYDTWLESGFRTKAGAIKDWKASLRKKAVNGWLLSQRRGPSAARFIPPTDAEVVAFAKQNKWPASYGKWCHQFFTGTGWRWYGKEITSTAQWQALMATELQDRAPR